MELPKSNEIPVGKLSRIFDNKSESYKLFWFMAIVNEVHAGRTRLMYEDLVDDMVAEAWYMVTQYRLNLGPVDNLESLIQYVYNMGQLQANEKKENIKNYIRQCEDKEVLRRKRILTQNVPYRLQAPFLKNIDWNKGEQKVAEQINRQRRLLYYFVEFNRMETCIEVSTEWADYIQKNYEVIRGWIQYNLILYLQKRNPDVPGISSKLEPPQERKLERVQDYWKKVVSISSINDIYTGKKLSVQDISIDHFIPWSYVAHDELWNLHPTTRSMNSKKNNKLPDWNIYFEKLCHNEYQALQIAHSHERIDQSLRRCCKENLNNLGIRLHLYEQVVEFGEFRRQMEHIMLPVYQAAVNQGFEVWKV